MNRRDMLGIMGLFGMGATVPGVAQDRGAGQPRVFVPQAFGAVGDGKTMDTRAIQAAIDACAKAGGGVVYTGPGTYLCGTIILKTNVTLYLEAGATILGSTSIADYLPQPGPNLKGDANQKHLIFARDSENVTLAGPGKIDGQGPAFWVPSGRVVPPAEESWRDVATYDWKPLDRASPLVEFYNCKNVRIQDMRIENASGWTLRPIQCENVFIRGITIKNPVIGPNTDGIDPTCCQNVFISDCLIDTGDDAICLKSESPYGGPVRVTKNVTINNCVLTCCCNGLKFGTATRGGFENVAFTNSVIFNEDVDAKARVISGIALEMVDGGWVEGVTISNIRMQRVRTPIFIRRGNRRSGAEGKPGRLKGVIIDGVHATGAILTSSITGLPDSPVEDVSLSNIRIDSEEPGKLEWTKRSIPEVPTSYPEARMFGRLPSHGLYVRHVKGLRLKGIELTATPSEPRPAITCDDVEDLEISGLRSSAIASAEPVVRLIDTRAAFVHGCTAPTAKTFLEVQGAHTDRIMLAANNLTNSEAPYAKASGVPDGAVRVL